MPAAIDSDGIRHRFCRRGSSVRKYPSRFASVVRSLNSSIQSGQLPSATRSVVRLAGMNSEITRPNWSFVGTPWFSSNKNSAPSPLAVTVPLPLKSPAAQPSGGDASEAGNQTRSICRASHRAVEVCVADRRLQNAVDELIDIKTIEDSIAVQIEWPPGHALANGGMQMIDVTSVRLVPLPFRSPGATGSRPGVPPAQTAWAANLPPVPTRQSQLRWR